MLLGVQIEKQCVSKTVSYPAATVLAVLSLENNLGGILRD